MPLEERRPQVKQMISVPEHSLKMENREKMNITGVEDVVSFNDNTVILQTDMGGLTVKGSELRINRLNVESGDVMIEGKIDSCEYSDNDFGQKGGGFFAKLFK